MLYSSAVEARTLSQILASCWRFGDAHPPFIAESTEPTWNQHYSKLIMIPIIILSGAIFHGEEKNAHYQRTRRRAVYALTSLPPLTLKLDSLTRGWVRGTLPGTHAPLDTVHPSRKQFKEHQVTIFVNKFVDEIIPLRLYFAPSISIQV